jgi:hypothetical protein
MRVRVAGQRLTRRLKRRLFDPVDRGDLRAVEHEHGLDQHPISPISSPVERSRSLTGSGARILNSVLFLATHLPSFSHARNPATHCGTIPRS